MKIAVIFFTLFLFAFSIFAHEFWLDPQHFYYLPGQTITVRFHVGENFIGENWSGSRSRVNALTLYTATGAVRLDTLLSNNKGDSLQFNIPEEGTAMLCYQSNESFIKLEGKKFNAYLKEDGLLNALAYRRLNHQLDSAGVEHYRRSVKTLLQIGDKRTSTASQPTTLPLDIIPQSNPYSLENNSLLKASILFRGMPLQNHLVNVWTHYANKTVHKILKTDRNGLISFPVKAPGKWMISTVVMERAPAGSNADWDSYWGSCTFGY